MNQEENKLPNWIIHRGENWYIVDIDAAKAAGETLPIELYKIPEFAPFFTSPPTKSGTIDFRVNEHSAKLFYSPEQNSTP